MRFEFSLGLRWNANMNYLKKNPDESIVYPFSLQQLKTENPNTSFPENIEDVAEEWNCYPVFITSQPEYNSITHTIVESEPELIDGKYFQKWLIIPYSLEEVKRNKLAFIESERIAVESLGWDSGRGKLGFSPNDVALLSGVFSLAKEAANLNLPLPSIISIENFQIDFNNIQEMTNMLLQYGAARVEISKQFAAKIRAVKEATTVEEVDGV